MNNNIQDLRMIEKEIENMTQDNLTVIYNIINENNENITRKSDCFLVNLGKLRDKTIKELLNFIYFLKENRKILEKDEIEKNIYKSQFNLDNNIHEKI